MDHQKREVQLGVTVLVSTLVLVIGFLWFERVRIGGGMDEYHADFPAVAGLQVGDRVQVRGIRMGVVTDLAIRQDVVRVSFDVDETVEMRQDARVKLSSKGIVGEVLLEIDPGGGEPAPPGWVFTGVETMALDQVAEVAGRTLQKVDSLVGELQEIIGGLNENGDIASTAAEVREAVSGLGSMVQENRSELRTLVRDAAAAAATLRETVEDPALRQAIEGAGGTLARADSLVASLGITAARADSLLSRIETGEGTLGRLMGDESLYAQADSTLMSLHRLLDELRRNPKRFFRLNVIDL
ncbi:MAG: MlaD family protein [Candidatus Krumholzibacteriia bacterium]